MFYVFAPLIVFSFFTIPIVSFARNLAAENLDFLSTDSAVTSDDNLQDEISSNDYLTPSLETTNILNPDPTFSVASASLSDSDSATLASDPMILDEENLFVENLKTGGESCHAEDQSFSPSIARRLRVRGGSDSEPEGGNSCESRPENSNGKDSDSFLEQLPTFFPPTGPGVEERRDVCPEKVYGEHKIPVCSTGLPFDEISVLGTSDYMLQRATPCKFLVLSTEDVLSAFLPSTGLWQTIMTAATSTKK